MAAIRSRDTKPEILLRKALFRRGARFRVKYKLPGKPDIVFPGRKLAVFMDGCFWHGCPRCYKEPDNNREFWQKKIVKNKERDQYVSKVLGDLGWTVIRVWEHEIRSNLDEVAEMIFQYLV